MRIFTCNTCSKIHLEVGNVVLHFNNTKMLAKYLQQLEEIDADYYTEINRQKSWGKELFLPLGDTSVNLAFTIEEFNALKKYISNYLFEQYSFSIPPLPASSIMVGQFQVCLN